MTKSSTVFRVGTRPSELARIQTAQVVNEFKRLVPHVRWEIEPVCSPGDRDRETDLRASPQDFFTRDLDEALLAGRIDCAVHSAKDLPDPMPEGVEWCWLPLAAEPRDAMVLPKGKDVAQLPENPRIGVSSERREAWAVRCFPGARLDAIRGNIEERLNQLDNGAYDAIVMAAAALYRLGYPHRVTQLIPENELEVPPGQGRLALTFASDDATFLRLRSLYVKPVMFTGAGPGDSGFCTQAGVQALRYCDTVLHDSLLDPALLQEVPQSAEVVDVGKRCGNAAFRQAEITRMIGEEARRGRRVVRLKGGDPGIFGRLAEETERLEKCGLPFRVMPGVSSLNAATSGTGMLLTRRGVSRGFTAMTPRQKGGGIAPVNGKARSELPVAFLMSAKVLDEISRQLLDDGMARSTPAAVVFNAGMPGEQIYRESLEQIAEAIPVEQVDQPGIFLVGELARRTFCRENGALQNRRICLTCSEALQMRARRTVLDYDGIPIGHCLIDTVIREEGLAYLGGLKSCDWLVVTSPSAVRCLMNALSEAGEDVRALPKILVSGTGTQRELEKYGVFPDAVPEEGFGGDAALEKARSVMCADSHVMRIRSDRAGPRLAEDIRKQLGAAVTDVTLYRTAIREYETPPNCEAVFFASSSAVEAWRENYGMNRLHDKDVIAIGAPTARTLKQEGVDAVIVAEEATAGDAIRTYAEHLVSANLYAKTTTSR